MGRFHDHPGSLPRLLVTAAAAVVIAIGTVLQRDTSDAIPMVGQKSLPAPASAAAVTEAPIVAVEAQLESMDQVSALLALEDTSSLTDSEISFLLY